MMSKIDLKKLTDKELWEKHNYSLNFAYDSTSPTGIPKYAFLANAYLTELQRRENKKSNNIMIFCTIAITIMTAVILWATLVGANIIGYGS